ncbi:MAG: glycerophosphodiester phosphodiesterase [Rhodoplanes sp.]|uniref:glycerophosphodiester phosphodiesterase family protein n=1 Tax=Rhodoplanes sp. TaxID=1968906 RepID=UPI0017AD1776|nr:glycerophosphodiester phosphodiesterase family protein [Rhodoplanes sp.]NVO13618.1 glycerophosphodiester phosphodiesterase [Rhodoplanes sp.]
MSPLAWLTAHPIAHRGLHDAAQGIVENTPAAVAAAVAAGYGVEVDLQPSADGEAMVHHDHVLGRLVEGREALRDLTAAELKARRFHHTADRMLTLGELLDLVGGRVPLLLELKSRFDDNTIVAQRAAAVLAGSTAPVAVMSFDPALIISLRQAAPTIVCGLVGERRFTRIRPVGRRATMLLDALRANPQFLAWRLQDLATPLPRLARAIGYPLLTWTVRSPAERAVAMSLADQVIFEGFRA